MGCRVACPETDTECLTIKVLHGVQNATSKLKRTKLGIPPFSSSEILDRVHLLLSSPVSPLFHQNGTAISTAVSAAAPSLPPPACGCLVPTTSARQLKGYSTGTLFQRDFFLSGKSACMVYQTRRECQRKSGTSWFVASIVRSVGRIGSDVMDYVPLADLL